MIKKVVVSAAGQGTRMLELTKDKSKHLIDVQDRPFFFFFLDNIYQAGYKEIILVVGFKGEMIEFFTEEFVKDKPNLDIKLVSQFEVLGPKEKEYGTACPIKCVKDSIGGENFISLCGDNFYSVPDLKAMNIEDGFNYVAGFKSDHPENFGVLLAEREFLNQIVEKPKDFVGNLVNTSLYKFTPEIFDKVFQIKKSPRGEYEITDAVSLLAKEGKVKVKELSGFWMDFGRPEDIKKFENFLRSGSSKDLY